MTLPAPFAYPSAPQTRRHGPRGYTDYGSYKPFLRDEFTFRCVYCLERERFYPNRDSSFSADHFQPKALKEALRNEYTNLVYCCTRCNSFKQTKITPLSPDTETFSEHFLVTDDGHIKGLTPEGQDLIDLMHLDESPALETRQKVLRILRIKAAMPDNAEVHCLLLDYLGFPDDLPDLSEPRPPANDKKDGIKESWFEKRQKGELPELY